MRVYMYATRSVATDVATLRCNRTDRRRFLDTRVVPGSSHPLRTDLVGQISTIEADRKGPSGRTQAFYVFRCTWAFVCIDALLWGGSKRRNGRRAWTARAGRRREGLEGVTASRGFRLLSMRHFGWSLDLVRSRPLTPYCSMGQMGLLLFDEKGRRCVP